MSNIYNAAIQIAEETADETAKNQLLGEIVQLLAQNGQHNEALKTLRKIPSVHERKILLLGWDWKTMTPDGIGSVVTLIESEPQTAVLAGIIASAMLESGKTPEALQLVQSAKIPFETERQRYGFLEQYLRQTDNVPSAKPLLDGFKDAAYRRWGQRAAVKRLAALQQFQEAETRTEALEIPQQRAWLFTELSSAAPLKRHYLERAGNILNALPLTFETSEAAENMAVQYRITGKKCYQSGLTELGETLLEKSEAAAKSVTPPVPHWRLMCHLAKVLRELKLLDSVPAYLSLVQIQQEPLSAIDRSMLLVWYNEAAGLEREADWLRIIETLNVKEKGTPDTSRTQRIAAVLKRFAAVTDKQRAHRQPSGSVADDAVNLSGEEYESYYFSPFAADDCGC
ncbi:MAG: hypothetical protein LBT89_12075 [Planctomycetaceae bacterium]|jgi:hypothetical protein|nr:hypothetical protein [Planctomycetaceae bacterium]